MGIYYAQCRHSEYSSLTTSFVGSINIGTAQTWRMIGFVRHHMTSQSSMVESAYAECFDDVRVEKDELSDWILITGKRKKE